MQTTQKIKNQALKLPLSDRAELAEALWESILNSDASEYMTEEEAINLALERDQEIENGARTFSHEEIMAFLRSID